MKTIDNFLTDLYKKDIKFWLETKDNNEVKLRFNAPEEILTDELISQLKELKPQIIEFLQSTNTSSKSSKVHIEKCDRTKPLPLSFAQQRLWFMEQLQPGANYNIPTGVRLQGNLKLDILEQSLNEIIRRHEVLRTNFQTESGQPQQIINPEAKINLIVHNLENVEIAEQEAKILELSSQETVQSFNLEKDLLLRVTVIRLNPQEHIVLLIMHHIISDGWSMDIVVRELITLYKTYSAGEKSPFPELELQYADFASWQREWLQGKVLEQQLSYGRQNLSGTLPVLQLPTDFSRSRRQTFKGANHTFELGTELTQKLNDLARESEVTLFMLLLAAYKILLSRYTGQDDIIVGVPIANRNRTEIEDLIGFFTNTLVLRSDLSNCPTFKQLLVQIKEITYSAYDNQDLPFEKLVEELQPERDLSYNPLFQAKFRLENLPQPVEIPGLSISTVKQTEFVAKLDLSLDMYQTTSGLVGGFEYNTDLFKPETISRLVGHFRTLLTEIVNKPDCPIAELSLLTAAEKQQILVDWNDTKVEFPEQLCFHQIFEAQAAKTPDNIALIFEQEKLTYAELNQKSSELAAYLSSLGVKPEVRVGIYCDRSFEMIIAFLAVLKAGGAYVPLDPAYPQDRLDYIVEDSQINILLTQAKYEDTFSAPQSGSLRDRDLTIINLNSPLPLRPSAPSASSAPSAPSASSAVSPENLAYIIYTSGSTGKPKGVLIPHRGLTNLTEHKIRACQVDADSCVLQFFSFSFDASIPEIIMSLGCGAKLCLATRETLLPGEGLLNLLRSQKVTHITMTPSALATLPAAELPDLKMVLVGGEAPSEELINQWSENRLFINAYGPTEVTVNASMVSCGNGNPSQPTIRPSENKQLYVCDRNLQLVPIGVVGELYIAGVGLARGYLNRPELTAEKFIPNPFSLNIDHLPLTSQSNASSSPPAPSAPSAPLLYKTGDLATYLPDGRIKLLGRIDNQVKIRGFRIEPGEIEILINQHPDVKISVVTPLVDNRNDKYLAAYVVLKPNSEVQVSSLRNFLQSRIPGYMIPQNIAILDSLPLNTNGKVDLKALPKIQENLAKVPQEIVAPRNANETKLRDIFVEVLEVESISIYDNFFELGGHSLLATKLIALLLEEFSIDINVIDLFEAPTVEGLAKRIENKIAIKEISESSSDQEEEREQIRI
ncbi:MAG: amino acid adenylation domain-containing protein [Cyanobacteria bacterium P01_F01_bin.143]